MKQNNLKKINIRSPEGIKVLSMQAEKTKYNMLYCGDQLNPTDRSRWVDYRADQYRHVLSENYPCHFRSGEFVTIRTTDDEHYIEYDELFFDRLFEKQNKLKKIEFGNKHLDIIIRALNNNSLKWTLHVCVKKDSPILYYEESFLFNDLNEKYDQFQFILNGIVMFKVVSDYSSVTTKRWIEYNKVPFLYLR
jgi:hypothetical protein